MLSRNGTIAAARGNLIKAQWAGPLLMFSASFLFAVMDCLIKELGASFRVWDIAFYRFGCSMAILLLCFKWDSNPFGSQDRKLLILRGVFGAAAFLVLIAAFQMIPISTAMVIFYSFPAFAAVFGAVLFKEKITRDLVWVIVTLLGTGIFFDASLNEGILGQGLSLLGAVFAGVAVAIVRRARQTNGSVIIYLYFCMAGAAMAFIPFVSAPRLPTSAHQSIMIGLIVSTSIIAQLLMNEGFHYCGSFQGSLFLTSEAVFVALWGFIFLSEPVTWHTLVGGAMILSSIVALSRRMAN